MIAASSVLGRAKARFSGGPTPADRIDTRSHDVGTIAASGPSIRREPCRGHQASTGARRRPCRSRDARASSTSGRFGCHNAADTQLNLRELVERDPRLVRRDCVLSRGCRRIADRCLGWFFHRRTLLFRSLAPSGPHNRRRLPRRPRVDARPQRLALDDRPHRSRRGVRSSLLRLAYRAATSRRFTPELGWRSNGVARADCVLSGMSGPSPQVADPTR